MTLLISDANILIDMVEGGILERMFQLPEAFAVPDVLYHQELSTHHPELQALGLECISLRPEGVQEALELSQGCMARDAPSMNDLFALMLARQEACPLLTGDKRLRQLAAQQYAEVELRGTLWLVDAMVRGALLTVAEAETAYQRMQDGNSRLPWAEVRKQIKQLRVEFGE